MEFQYQSDKIDKILPEYIKAQRLMSSGLEKNAEGNFGSHDVAAAKHGAGHLPHHKFFQEHKAGHDVHTEAVQKFCTGGKMK